MIKANLPSRISFQVASKIDSRTILDAQGAEKLLGNGDMLFLPPGTARVRRIHGAYVSESEINEIVDFVKKNQGEPKFLEEITKIAEEKSGADGIEYLDDPKYDDAVRVVLTHRPGQRVVPAAPPQARLLPRRAPHRDHGSERRRRPVAGLEAARDLAPRGRLPAGERPVDLGV